MQSTYDPIWRLVLQSFNDVVILMFILSLHFVIIGLVEDPGHGAYEFAYFYYSIRYFCDPP